MKQVSEQGHSQGGCSTCRPGLIGHSQVDGHLLDRLVVPARKETHSGCGRRALAVSAARMPATKHRTVQNSRGDLVKERENLAAGRTPMTELLLLVLDLAPASRSPQKRKPLPTDFFSN